MSTTGTRGRAQGGGWRARALRHAAGASLILLLAAVVAPCGSGTQQSSGGSDSGGGKVTLTLKHISGTDQTALAPLISAFEKQNPNIKINASFAPTDDLQTSLRAQLGGGNAPDSFVGCPGNGSAVGVQPAAPAAPTAPPDRRGPPPARGELGEYGAPEPQAAARRRRQDVPVVARHDPDRRHLKQEGLQGGGRRQAAELVAGAARRRRQDQGRGQDPVRGGQSDAVGDAADPVRDR